MNPPFEDKKRWKSAINAGVVSVAFLLAGIIPIGLLIAPLSLPASLVSFVYAILSYRRNEPQRSRAIIGVALALVAPTLLVGVLIFG